jgi:neutral amino acid transport system ATP-binding protein
MWGDKMLRVQNLKKHFGGVRAVDGCSFKVERGKITALIGPNGSGKSTVFNLISGISKIDSGKVILDKKEITDLAPHKISQKGISRLFQQARLFENLTVKENLALALDSEDTKFWKNLFGRKKVDDKMVKENLESLGLERFENRLSRGLSYGQKRLVEILRVMMKPHKVLMLDEPVAGVTPLLRRKISTLLKGLRKKGETILLIEHDMNFALNLVDWVVVLDAGKVIAEGTPKEIRKNKKVLEAYLGD